MIMNYSSCVPPPCLREFGCGGTVKLVAMHDASAATEVVYYASEKLDENAMHYEHRHQAPWGCGGI